jgi:transposase
MLDPVGGCDPHLDTFDLVTIDGIDRELSWNHWQNSPQGWRAALTELDRFGIRTLGIENASGYGVGLARAAAAAGIEVIDIPTRVTAVGRRANGSDKTDRIDARVVARAVLAGKGNRWVDTPELEAIRVLSHRRQALVRDQTRDINQLRALLINIDPQHAARLGRLRSTRAFGQLACLEPQPDPTLEIIADVIRNLAQDAARRLTQIRTLERQLAAAMPPRGQHLIDTIEGCGTITAAILLSELAGTDGFTTEARFAKWSGAAPLDASSGKQEHHRLNRGGNRQANRALHTIVITQLQHGGEAATYITRRQHQGLTRKSAIRAAKRYIARRIWKTLHNTNLT